MAKAGYCDVCGENVWLADDGSCAKGGHTREHISNAHDEEPPAAPPPAPAPKRRKLAVTVALVLSVLLGVVLLCGLIVAIAVPAFHTPRMSANQKTCFANQRTVLTAFKSYRANGGKDVVTMDELVAAALLDKVPACPDGGKYQWDPLTHEIRCTIHGTVQGLPATQ